MADTRTPRDQDGRDAEKRIESWTPPNTLPDPHPRDGVVFRWVRTATYGESDPSNVSTRFREGWRPVKLSEVPELQVMPDKDGKFPENAEVGGLVLCANSRENMEARDKYHQDQSQRQVNSADHAFMRENDPRMPLLRTQRSTRVTKGHRDDT